MTTQQTNNILYYLIGRRFRNINILFVLSFKSDSNHAARDSLYSHFRHSAEIKFSMYLLIINAFFNKVLDINKKHMNN